MGWNWQFCNLFRIWLEWKELRLGGVSHNNIHNSYSDSGGYICGVTSGGGSNGQRSGDGLARICWGSYLTNCP